MRDPIQGLNAALQGRYRIESEVGEGGMATVYLADDIKHERKVALKVLKPELAAVVGAERFLAEIKTTANLQHPHILPLFDSGEADSFLFYVMPYVEGESLRDRLDREHQLPVDDAVRIATNMAEALDYAHRQGVIHRDIKPANILLQDGKPVISDFGIALAVSTGGGGRLTETGLSLGTPHYMSPEQATGDQNVGPATDVYALGCVLYEMLVGEPPFTGSTPQAVLGQIISGEPDPASEHRRSVPSNVDAAIRRALEKVPADRFGRAADFAKAVSDEAFRHEKARAPAFRVETPWMWVAVVFVTAAAAWYMGWAARGFEGRDPPALAQFDLNLGDGLRSSNGGRDVTLSPDGNRVVYVGAAEDGGLQLWERRMADLEPRPIPGTSGREGPVVAADADLLISEDLSTISVGGFGGEPITELAVGGRDAAVGADGMVYFIGATPGSSSGERGSGTIYRVPITGGVATEFGRADEQLRFLHVLPNGAGLLATIARESDPQRSGIAVIGPEGGAVRELFSGAMALYSGSGHIVYATADGTLILMAAPFDLAMLEPTAPALAVLEGIAVKGTSAAQFDLSETGTLVYVAGNRGEARLVWVDRAGNAREVDPSFSIESTGRSLALSPSGDRLAYSTSVDGVVDVWVKGLDRGPAQRISRGAGTQSFRPSWSEDEQFVTYISNQAGNRDVWTRRADGSGDAVLRLDGPDYINEAQFSPNGEWLVYRVVRNREDIFATHFGADTVEVPIVATAHAEWQPALSPDGRWLAYRSDESGRSEVYVVPFPEGIAESRVTISTSGGEAPLWSHDGEELFYRNGADYLVVAQVEAGDEFAVIDQQVLFSTARFVRSRAVQVYDVGPDDGEFIMFEMSEPDQSRLILVQNFFEVLKRLVPN